MHGFLSQLHELHLSHMKNGQNHSSVAFGILHRSDDMRYGPCQICMSNLKRWMQTTGGMDNVILVRLFA